MNCAKCWFWSPTGEYICVNQCPHSNIAKECTTPSCWKYYYQPDTIAWGNKHQDVDKFWDQVAYWQCTHPNFRIIQPKISYPRFPRKITQPLLDFPHHFKIRVPRSSDQI